MWKFNNMATEGTDWFKIAHEWQTLIAGGLALLAAIATVLMIRRQINQQRSQFNAEIQRHEEVQRRKALAAKARLPDALSALCRYSEECATYLIAAGPDKPLPSSPDEAINIVKASIEYLDETSMRKIMELTSHFQIHNSRFQDVGGLNSSRYRSERLYDTVYLRYLVDRLFEFARNTIDSVPDTETTTDDFKSALRVCVGLEYYYGNEEQFKDVEAIILRRHSEPQSTATDTH